MTEVWAVYWESSDGCISLISIWSTWDSACDEVKRLDKKSQEWASYSGHEICRFELDKEGSEYG